MLFRSPCVILGGGVFEQPFVIEQIRAEVMKQIMPSFRTVRIEAATLGNKAGLLGVVKMALDYQGI